MKTTTQTTPGYNCRIQIAFTADKNGNALAMRWSGSKCIAPGFGRWIRMSLDVARVLVAAEQVDVVSYLSGSASSEAN